MKRIQPLNIWQNGKLVVANFLKINITYDNLVDTAYLSFFLFSENELEIYTGTIQIDGDTYKKWDGSSDQTYQIAASILNIQLS